MRVGLILASNLYMSPYIRYYTEILDESTVSYDIISWNRFGVHEDGTHAFELKTRLNKNIAGKVIDSLRYCRFVESRVGREAYDKLVVFTLQNALMLSPFLQKHYCGRYAIDIRDYSVANRLFGFRLPRTIQNAALTVISSAGYRFWLPEKHDYVVGHNIANCQPLEMQARIEGNAKYKILTIGAIGYYEANRSLIEELAGSTMFELEFVGSGTADRMLRDFAANQCAQNVTFKGRYAKEDEPKLVQGAAIISILMDGTLNSTTLMSNRFYLALVHGIPVMVDEGTEQARWVQKYDLGIIIDKKGGLREQLVGYLHSFDRGRFDAGRRACLQVIQQETDTFKAQFRRFLCQ
jgi:hypothetical protein